MSSLWFAEGDHEGANPVNSTPPAVAHLERATLNPALNPPRNRPAARRGQPEPRHRTR
jgi:hypothetical protein